MTKDMPSPREARRQPPGGRIALQVGFSAVKCDRCGDKRVATQPCPSCGKAPKAGEFDSKAQRRKRAATLLRARLDAEIETGIDQRGLSALLGGLAGMPSRLVAAFGGLDAGGAGEHRALAEAAAVVDEVRNVQASVAHDWPRPWRRFARSARQPVSDMRMTLATLLDAYAADDLGQAQAKAVEMQTWLDSCAEHANAFWDDLFFAEHVLSLDGGDLLSACVARELERLGVAVGGLEALVALDQAGRERLPVLSNTGQPGMGLQAQAMLLPASILLDPDALVALTCATSPLLRQDRFRELALDPEWTTLQRAATTVLVDACQRLTRLVEPASASGGTRVIVVRSGHR